jgi:hypothetical protein
MDWVVAANFVVRHALVLAGILLVEEGVRYFVFQRNEALISIWMRCVLAAVLGAGLWLLQFWSHFLSLLFVALFLLADLLLMRFIVLSFVSYRTVNVFMVAGRGVEFGKGGCRCEGVILGWNPFDRALGIVVVDELVSIRTHSCWRFFCLGFHGYLQAKMWQTKNFVNWLYFLQLDWQFKRGLFNTQKWIRYRKGWVSSIIIFISFEHWF